MNNWDEKFINLADHISSWSKDPSRKIGAVITNSANNNILSMGYNGFPVGVDDNRERLTDRTEKYKYIVHAEMNAIYNAAKNGVSMEGATIYVTGLPVCSECMKALIQSGIKRIVSKYGEVPDNWAESSATTKIMAAECGIEIEEFINEKHSTS